MTKTASSQPQNSSSPFAGFDPMETFTKLTSDNVQRLQAFYDELAAWEAKAYDRAKKTADQLSDLASESFNYATKLAAEWRELSLEATRRSTAMFRGA